ncbi:ABC transporter ATP-binding protein [Bacillaceae bacterium Marseille-Q3522]|nr:ABC transporter ATP-binding protein [Bacillaceae bacterium Marseille-Q3522]
MLNVQHLTKVYANNEVLSDVNFSLQEGKTTALVGPNGAGKTTMLHILSGLMRPTKGEIVYQQQTGDIRQLIGFLPQYPAFYPWMSALEYLVYAARLGKRTKKEAEDDAQRLLAKVGLEQAKKQKIAGFSGGMKQRLGIAQALVHRPKLLLLDEPVSALDPGGRTEVISLLNEMKQDNLTILYSTHVLHDAETLCDDVLILKKGKLILFDHLEALYSRFDRPVVKLKAAASIENWTKSLKQKYPTFTIQTKGHDAKIQGVDINTLRETVVKEIVTAHVPLRSLEIGIVSLEEVFNEVMEND